MGSIPASPSKYKYTAFNLPMPASFYVLTNLLIFSFDTTCSEPHTVLNRQKLQPLTCFICVFLNRTGSYPEGHVIFYGFCQDFQCVLFSISHNSNTFNQAFQVFQLYFDMLQKAQLILYLDISEVSSFFCERDYISSSGNLDVHR